MSAHATGAPRSKLAEALAAWRARLSEVRHEVGDFLRFTASGLRAGFRRPLRPKLFLQQAEFVGYGSLFIVLLTGLFTGAVFTLQSVNALSKVGMESMVGSMVMLATSRELGPVLASLMVAGRVGSAMATELGTMRVSEQIDAMEVMAIDPLSYLIAPRLYASFVMVPALCLLFDMVANIGSYLVAVVLMGIDEGAFWSRIGWYLDPTDFVQGILKSAVFGLLVAAIGCHRGFYARGGARGVGESTTQSVVFASVGIFMLDYVMTAILLKVLPG